MKCFFCFSYLRIIVDILLYFDEKPFKKVDFAGIKSFSLWHFLKRDWRIQKESFSFRFVTLLFFHKIIQYDWVIFYTFLHLNFEPLHLLIGVLYLSALLIQKHLLHWQLLKWWVYPVFDSYKHHQSRHKEVFKYSCQIFLDSF